MTGLYHLLHGCLRDQGVAELLRCCASEVLARTALLFGHVLYCSS